MAIDHSKQIQLVLEGAFEDEVQAALDALLADRRYDAQVAAGEASLAFVLNRVARHFYMLGHRAAHAETVELAAVAAHVRAQRHVRACDDDAPEIEINDLEDLW